MLGRFAMVVAVVSFASGLTSVSRMGAGTGEAVLKAPAGLSVPVQAARQPGPQIERLIKTFEGSWAITEELAPDASSPKGKTGAGTIVFRPGPGGYSVIEEYRSKQGNEEITGLGTFWWDEAAQGYRTIWCDSTNPGGCIDFKKVARWDSPHHWDGTNLVLQEDYESNGRKFTFKEVFSDLPGDSFTQTLYGAEVGHELKVDQVIHAKRTHDLTAASQGASKPQLVQPVLTEPGSTPFHLQAIITERADPNERVDVEMFWAAPDKWRRTIRSQEFTQTLVVNGGKVFEQDSDGYIPLGIETLVMAMVDPRPILNAVRPEDPVRSKANGEADESGRICFDPNGKMCTVSPFGLSESVSAPGYSVKFADYQKFKEKRVARRLLYHIDAGDSLLARVMTLGEYESRDDGQFAIANPTPAEQQIRTAIFSESELHSYALQPLEIVWPQVLEDGHTSGETSYYISIDRAGNVREVLPLSVSVERADDSARRQMMKWKFKPVFKDGLPVQSEAVFNFHFDTRAYGPAKPLTDVEVRALPSNTVDPVFPEGSKSGEACTIRFAVDSEGIIIESMNGGGSPELSGSCMNALGKWRFSPVMINGEPRPYRAEVTFRVP